MKELEQMTLTEYELRMTAQALKNTDEYEKLAHLALYIRKAQDYDPKTGIYTVQSVKDLVDVSAAEKAVFEEPVLTQDGYNRLTKIQKNLEDYRKQKEVGISGE